jgi:alkylhydroperoxidase family enzyme
VRLLNHSQPRPRSEGAGIPSENLEALAGWEASPLFDELERLVLRYAEQITPDVQVDPTLVEALKARLSAEALVQLPLSVAAANFTNRFNEALGTELEASARS